MSKYHVNDAGDPGDCIANIRCPFGGDEAHFDSAGEARSAYEAKMNQSGSTLPVTRINRLRDEAKKAYKDDFPKYELNASEKSIIEKALSGQKVSDEKLDKLLDSHFDLERIASNRDKNTVKSVQKVFRHLRNVRKKSDTPSTLVTGSEFDPSTQSAFSNKDARHWPEKMAKAITRELKHGDWLRELADRSAHYREVFPEATDEEYEAQKSEAATLREKAERSDARSQAMLTELKWKMTHDPQFASRATLEARSALNRYRFDESLNVLPIGTVRKIAENE